MTGSHHLEELTEEGSSITYGVVKPGPDPENGVLFIRGGDIKNGKINIFDLRRISTEISEQYSRTLLQGGELLVSLVGNPGEVAIVPDSLRGANIARQVGMVRLFESVNAQFVKYFLLSPEGKARLGAQSLGSVQTVINLRDLKRVEIPDFGEKENNKISGALAKLDEKIELNEKTNETLEAMAQAIFKDWFVDFGPVRLKAEGKVDPVKILGGLIHDRAQATRIAALFPEKFSENSLPKGWEYKILYDQANWINGAAYKKMHFVDADQGLPVVKIAELKNGITKQTKFTNTELGDKFRINNGDLLFSWSGNPETSINAFLWSKGPAWLNQHIFVVRENGKLSKAVSYFLLKLLKPTFTLIAKDKQTTGLGHVTKSDMKRLEICLGDRDVMQEYANLVQPIYDRIINNLYENQTLAEARDYLLPKLMSGEVRVADIYESS